jgi:hypothetical protein
MYCLGNCELCGLGVIITIDMQTILVEAYYKKYIPSQKPENESWPHHLFLFHLVCVFLFVAILS